MLRAAEKKKLPFLPTITAITRRVRSVDKALVYHNKITNKLELYANGQIARTKLQNELKGINKEIWGHRKELAIDLAVPIIYGSVAGGSLLSAATTQSPLQAALSGGLTVGANAVGTDLIRHGSNLGAFVSHPELKGLKQQRKFMTPIVKIASTLTPAEASKLVEQRRKVEAQLNDYALFLENQKLKAIEQQRAKKAAVPIDI